MKKIISVLLVVIMLVTSLFVLTGCNSQNNNGNENQESSKGNGVNLKYDSSLKNTSYNAQISTNSDDNVSEIDESEPNFVRIENEGKNYTIDLTLDEASEGTYEQLKYSAKENDVFEEVKFEKHAGYYSNDGDDELYGYIVLDDSDSDAYIYIIFDLYLYNEDDDSSDIQEIYNSSNIQNILNNVEFKTSSL